MNYSFIFKKYFSNLGELSTYTTAVLGTSQSIASTTEMMNQSTIGMLNLLLRKYNIKVL